VSHKPYCMTELGGSCNCGATQRPILFGGAIFDARPNGDQWTESVSYRPAEVFTPEPEEEATS
jgi:hypothetical protein